MTGDKMNISYVIHVSCDILERSIFYIYKIGVLLFILMWMGDFIQDKSLFIRLCLFTFSMIIAIKIVYNGSITHFLLDKVKQP